VKNGVGNGILARDDAKALGMKRKILVVDDEPDIVEVVRYNLTKEGYEVNSASNGDEGLERTKRFLPDLLILDLMLPGLHGLDVCKLIKGDPDLRDIFILILSAKGEESDVIKGLDSGADDYLPKPFSPKVLLARVRSLLRRSGVTVDEERSTVEIEGLLLDPNRHEFFVDGAAVELTSTEFKIIELLMRKVGWVFTRSKIVDEVHGEDYPVTDRSIDVQMVGLRRKLGRFGPYIETVRGVGYRFKDVSASKP
jgi:two-component system alkaline phosphatase synthesis response regulator PhoP